MSHPGESLSAYLDGEATAEEVPRIQAHLVTCGECRSELERIKAARAALRSLPLLAPVGPTRGARVPYRRLPQTAAAAVAVVLVALGAAAMTMDAQPIPLPAAELSILLTAYTSVSADVQSFVPVTESTIGVPGRVDRLPARVGEYELVDERMWGSDATVGFYRGEDGSFVVLVSRTPFEVSGLSGEEVWSDDGAYLRGRGDHSILYVWETRTGWMVLLGAFDELEARSVLAGLPAPDQPGLVGRWWKKIVG